MRPQLFLALTMLPLLQQAAAQSTDAAAAPTTAVPMATTTPWHIGGFTSEQLGVLIGIPVALVIIILIGIIIGCVVQHKVLQEDKLLDGKPYQSEVGPDGRPHTSLGRNPMYYTDYLNSQTKMN